MRSNQTDIALRDILHHIELVKAFMAGTFLLTLKNRNWMKQSKFAVFLTRLGHNWTNIDTAIRARTLTFTLTSIIYTASGLNAVARHSQGVSPKHCT